MTNKQTIVTHIQSERNSNTQIQTKRERIPTGKIIHYFFIIRNSGEKIIFNWHMINGHYLTHQDETG